MFKFRNYQSEIIEKGRKALSKLRIIMLCMEVRTGKTLTALGIADSLKVKSVLFITTKKVIDSKTIVNDHELLSPNFEITLINYESIHKLETTKFDLVIVDESHKLGAFPKPSLRTKRIKELIGRKYTILLTGTPTPESYSQIYHQFFVSDYSPFEEDSFYKWARNYVNITQKKVSYGRMINDYSKAKVNLIKQKISKHLITYTQKEAGFKSKVVEKILTVKMKPSTYALAKKLEKDKVFKGENGGVILADTPVKLMQKMHQIYSGTVKLEDGTAKMFDKSKAEFIKSYFKCKKLAIFYKFKQELSLLEEVFNDDLTTDLEEFNSTNKSIALQVVSGREGISLSKADHLVFYNIDFSATSYWQSRDRLTTKEREKNEVFYIFSKGGLEEDIYKSVLNKKSYTTSHYERSRVSA